MEPQNNLQKSIGIILGFIVMLGVFFVTIFLGKQSGTTPPLAPLLNQGGDGSGNSIPQNVSTPTPTPTPIPVPVSNPNPVVTSTPPPVDIPKKSISVYNDGTYSATGSYMSPGGYDQLGVSVTLKNDIITGASVTNMGGDRRSQRYQDQFISGYQKYVVGQNIANVFLTKISGASLTPKGFNDALTQIKAQAKA